MFSAILPRRLLAAALLSLAALARPAAAQTAAVQTAAAGSIEGTVTDARTGAVVADAMVRVDSTRLGAITDEAGRFRIHQVPAGHASLTVSRVGYARRSVDVTVNGAVRVDVSLGAEAAVLSPVVVSATRERQRRADASATIDVLDGAEIRRTRASHPSQILNRVPGVHVSDLTGEGHSTAIRQPITTKPMYLYLEDGVPTRSTGFFNHNALYEVNIPQAAGVEVLKGPGTALYGSDAIGGVINVLTRPAPVAPTVEASVESGVDGYRRLLATGGATRGGNGLRVDLNATAGDGWKEASRFTRTSGTARWDFFGSRGLTARTVVTATGVEQHDVATLSADEYRDTPALNKSPIAFRTVNALRASTALELDRGASLWSVTPYARHDALSLIPSWQLSYDPQLWDTRNYSLGALAKYRRDFAPLRARVIVGADVDYSPGTFTADGVTLTKSGDGNRVWSDYAVGQRQYDYDVSYRQLAPYVHTEATVLPRLRLDAGLRYDASGYTYHTNLPPLDTARAAHKRPADTDVSYRHLSPKLGLTFDAARGVSLFASYRHGFRAPSQSQLFQQNSAASTVDLRPVTVDSYETGARGQLGRRVLYELSLYDMSIHDDIVTYITPANARVATNAGATRHRGIEMGTSLALRSDLKLDASYSVARHRYVTWTPQAARAATATAPAVAAVDYSGNEIENAPHVLGNALLTYSPRQLRGGRIAAEWNQTGRYAEDPQNTHGYAGYHTFNLHANYMLTSRAELFARVINVLDRRYAELATYDVAQREQLTPGAPRSIFGGVRVGWER